jgi:hypothetical protein
MQLILLMLLAWVVMASATGGAEENPLVLHVSTDGDEAATGTAAAPLASPRQAIERARDARHDGQPVEIVLAAGTYFLDEPIVLDARDSHTTLRAADGAAVTISGARRLSLAWRPSSLAAGALEASVPAGLRFDQLWIDDRAMWMARFPNRSDGVGFNVFDTWKLNHRFTSDPPRDPLAPQRIARWRDPRGAFLHAMHPALWGGVHFRVTAVNPDGTLALEGGTQNNRGSALHGAYRFVEGIREELDAPGEWFHDAASNTLHLVPPPDVDLDTAAVFVSRLESLVEIRGTRAAPARHITLRGLGFRHTDRTFMKTREPLLRSDWTIHRGGAVFVSGSEDVAIEACVFRDLGGNGVFVSDYARRVAIRRSHVTEVGASGICFLGSPEAVRNPLSHYNQRLPLDQIDRTPGPRGDDYPADCLVEDSLIHRTGRVEKQTAGVQIDMARRVTIRHCSIYDLPRAGINVGSGCWGGHLVEGCDVFDTVLETGDHGSFNSWGRDRFWENFAELNDPATFERHRDTPLLDAVEKTILRDSRWRCDFGWDIDLDDGSSNYRIVNNLCLRGGIKLREGFARVVENNVMLHNGVHPHVWYRFGGDVVRRNIVGVDRYAPARMHPPPWGAEMDANFVHDPSQATPKPATTLAGQSGRDARSLVGDAGFVDPQAGDFRLREDSPARALGFVSFDTRGYGVRTPALRAIARTPSLAAASPVAVVAAEAEVRWHGARVKSLGSMEEASSVGVALSRGGAIVLEVADGSAAERAGLRRGDLIVSADGHAVRDASSLESLPVERLVVVRGQVERPLP